MGLQSTTVALKPSRASVGHEAERSLRVVMMWLAEGSAINAPAMTIMTSRIHRDLVTSKQKLERPLQ